LVHDGGFVLCFLNRFKVFKYDGSLNYEKKCDKLYQVCYSLRYDLGHFIIVELKFFFDTFNAYSFLSETPKKLKILV
jgi:hypothetical protein